MFNIRFLALTSLGFLTLLMGRSAVLAQTPRAEPSQPKETAPPLLSQRSIPRTQQNSIEPEIEPLTLPPSSVEPIPPSRPVQPSAPPELRPGSNPLLFPTSPAEVSPELVQPITLQQAVDLALESSQELEIARLSLQRSQQALQEALAGQFPTIDLSADISRLDSAGTELQLERANAAALQTFGSTGSSISDTLTGQIELNYNVYSGGRIASQIKAARRQSRVSELNLEQVSEDIRFQTTQLYYQLQNADAQETIARAAVEDSAQTLRDAQLLEQAGLGTRFDVLRGEVELANANQDLTQALANQRIARRELAEVINVSQEVILAAADEIAEAGTWDLGLEESIVQAFKNRAELEQFLLEREINEQQRQIALADVRPQVTVFANYNLRNELDDSVTGFGDGYAFGAQLNWRIFDGGSARAQARQSETDILIDEQEFANERDQIRLEVETAYFNLQANQENIQTSEKAVTLAEESLRLARLRFQAGVGTQTDVINSQTELTNARANFLDAIISYNLSLNELQRSVSNYPEGILFDLPDRP